MKVALCCIGRLENQYAVEYVEYYKSIGFDKIFIYDNNHDGEEHFEDVLQTYIDDGFVTVIDYRNKEAAQLSAYNDCYSKYGNEYDWIAFFDFDEFLTLVKDKDIKSYLSHFDGFQGVKINWMVYTDNGLVKNDGRKVLERFTTPMEYDNGVTYKFPENYHVKSVLRTGNNFIWKETPHNIRGVKYSASNGKPTNDSPFQPYNYEYAYIKHFPTKTIEEFINGKLKRGVADRTNESYINSVDRIGYFFKINEKTDEKEKYIDEALNSYANIFICTHKEFEPVVHNRIYKTLSIKDINVNLPLKDDFFSELCQFKYVYDNIKLPKYIGFCHYRRYFSFMDNVPDFDKIFSDYDVVVAKPISNEISNRKQYELCHNIDDLNIIGGIVTEKYPEYSNAYETFLNGNTFIPYNMFIMKREDFINYAKFIFGVLDEYLKIVGTDIKKRINENKDKYLKKNYPGNSIEYQHRIGGYLAERLTNIFVISKFKKIKTYSINITESKYPHESNSKLMAKYISNTNIFIGTQKTFTPVVKNDAYKIVVGNHEIENNSNLELIKCNNDLKLDDRFYSELYMLYYVSKNIELPKYVGFCHNRRYFSFLDNIPDLDKIFSEYDAIAAKPKILRMNVKSQYSIYHNVEDLYIIGGIIAEKYPEQANMWKNFINGNILIPYNMFIMKREDFKEYIDFIFSILDEYLKIIGTDINKRIYDNYEKYIKRFYPNDSVEYQYRIGGYIAERLTNLFMMHKFKKIKTYPVIVTEDKYKQNKKDNP